MKKKRKLDVQLRKLQLQYSDSTTIINEKALNQVLHTYKWLSFKCQRRNDKMEG